MIMWLDHKLFGNGYGLPSPYYDARFFWLSGELYHYSPGFGAQLSSFQWTHPKPGERRLLCDREFRPFNSTRTGPRVRVAWAMVEMPRDINAANAALRLLETELGRTLLSSRAEREDVYRRAILAAHPIMEAEG